MFRPQKPQAPQRNRPRLDTWTAAPTLDDIKTMAAEAATRAGSMIDVLIKRPGCNTFVLTCQHDAGTKEPVWALYEGEDGSKPQWTYPNGNLEMICEIICMSLPGGAASSIPSDLAPKPEAAPAPAASPHTPLPAVAPNPAPSPTTPPQNPYGAQPPGYGSYPPPAPAPGYPQQAPPPAPYPPPQQPYGQPYPSAGAPQGFPQQPPYPPQSPPYPNQFPPPAPQQSYAQPGWGQPAPAFTPPAPGFGQPYGNYAQPPAPTPAPAPPAAQSAGAAELRPTDLAYSDLMTNRGQSVPLLGNMLVEAGMLPEPCIETALKLQELVRKGLLSSAAAIEALKKASERGGILDDDIIAACRAKYPDTNAITASQTYATARPAGQQLDPRELARAVVQMVQQAGIVSDNDIATAEGIRRKHGGEIGNMLVAAGKMERATLDAAKRIFPLVREHRMNQEEAFRVLRHCQKTKGSVEDACRDLSIRIL